MNAPAQPNWNDLEVGNRRSPGRRPLWDSVLGAVPTLRLALMILAGGVLVTLYIGHVHATQTLATEVESLRRENLALHLQYNQVKGAFDRASGPSVIYTRARRLGLSEALPNGHTIQLP